MKNMKKKNKKVIVALLTGKGINSLKDKNTLPVLGKPLMAYPATVAKKSKLVTHYYVSSDSDRILNIGEKLGYKKIKEPKIKAQSNHRHIDSLLFALGKMKEDEVIPDILVVLLANSVSIKKFWLEDCIRQIIKDDSISAVVPVVLQLDKHPYRAKKIGRDGFLEPFFDFGGKNISTNRQDLEPSYFLCHNFWALNMKNSIYSTNGHAPWKFMGSKAKPYIIKKSIDVHERDDLNDSIRWLKNYGDR